MPLVPLAPYKVPRKAAQAKNHQVSILMAPTNGLNLRDPYLLLQPTDALVLNNFIARPQGIELRKGYKKHVTGLGGEVASLLPYLAQDPVDNRLFATVGENIFDATISEESPAPVETGTGCIDGVWSSVMFNGPTLNSLCCTSPGGGYWTYDATNGWTDRAAAVTGFSGDFGPIAAWKNRLFFIESQTARCYYLPVYSIQGAAAQIDLGPLLKHGGHLVAVINWTMNAGIDIDDYLVFFGSQGDVIVYAGTDPDDPATFALKGIWYMGRPPAGDRFFHEYGGELFVLTELGLLPLSKMVNGQVADTYNVMSARIQPKLSPQITEYINTPGWEVGLSDDNDLLLIKAPNSGPPNYIWSQWVMNIQTGAWSTFTGMPMNVWVTYLGQMYFGTTDGMVCKGLFGDLDAVNLNDSGGNQILSTVQGGFSDFGSPANWKIFSMVRPMFLAEVAPSVAVQVNVDYSDNPIYSDPQFNEPNNSKWDIAHWDESTWLGAAYPYAAWAGVQAFGYYASLRMAVKGKSGTKYISSNLMYQVGGEM